MAGPKAAAVVVGGGGENEIAVDSGEEEKRGGSEGWGIKWPCVAGLERALVVWRGETKGLEGLFAVVFGAFVSKKFATPSRKNTAGQQAGQPGQKAGAPRAFSFCAVLLEKGQCRHESAIKTSEFIVR